MQRNEGQGVERYFLSKGSFPRRVLSPPVQPPRTKHRPPPWDRRGRCRSRRCHRCPAHGPGAWLSMGAVHGDDVLWILMKLRLICFSDRWRKKMRNFQMMNELAMTVFSSERRGRENKMATQHRNGKTRKRKWKIKHGYHLGFRFDRQNERGL